MLTAERSPLQGSSFIVVGSLTVGFFLIGCLVVVGLSSLDLLTRTSWTKCRLLPPIIGMAVVFFSREKIN
jgi:hypothetical protein